MPFTALIEILKKMLAPQLLAITDDIHDAPIVYLDLMFNTALAAEFQQRPPPINETR